MFKNLLLEIYQQAHQAWSLFSQWVENVVLASQPSLLEQEHEMGKLSGDENSPEETKKPLSAQHIRISTRVWSDIWISTVQYGLPLLASLTIRQNQAFHLSEADQAI